MLNSLQSSCLSQAKLFYQILSSIYQYSKLIYTFHTLATCQACYSIQILQLFQIPSASPMQKSTNPRQTFFLLRTKQINELPILTFTFNNKQDLRSIITDYVLHHIEEESRGLPSKRFKSKLIKYPNINLKVNVNKEERDISFQFVNFLSKYIEIEKKNIYRQGTIEPLVVDILNFIDEIQEKTKGVIFQIEVTKDAKKMEQEILNLIIEKHHKDKQKKCYNVEIDEYRKKIRAKHAKISYIDIEDHLKKKEKQFLLQISDLGALDLKIDCGIQRNIIVPNPTSTISDSLTSLIESGDIFENPDKIQQLKKQKLIQFYQSNQVEYLNYQTAIADSLRELGGQAFTGESQKMMKEWMVDIGISEKYYQMKYGRSEKRKKVISVDLVDRILDATVL